MLLMLFCLHSALKDSITSVSYDWTIFTFSSLSQTKTSICQYFFSLWIMDYEVILFIWCSKLIKNREMDAVICDGVATERFCPFLCETKRDSRGFVLFVIYSGLKKAFCRTAEFLPLIWEISMPSSPIPLLIIILPCSYYGNASRRKYHPG